MNFTSDYNAFRQNAYKKRKTTGDEFTDEFINALDDEHYQQYEDLAPVKKQTETTTKTEAPVKEEKDDRKWFEKGAFEDGYQFGDIFKTIEGSARDLSENVMAGILGIGEAAVDAGAYVAGGVGKLFGADEFAEDTKEFISKDLYDEKEVAKKILDATTFSGLWAKPENSVFGDKTDSLVQSGGQLLGTVGLQAVGVPWFVTTGVTSFGSEAENAFNQGATYGEAGLSAAISAGAEILTEKLFGGSGLGEKGLINLEPLTKGIANKAAKALADYGIDVVAEGGEEIFSQFMSNLGSSLYREENLKDILLSEEAVDGYIESAIGGGVLGGVMNVGKVGSSIKNKTDYRTGLPNEQTVTNEVADEPITEEQVEPQTPEENVFQNEMEKLTEQTENTIPEEAAVEEEVAEEKQPSSPKDLMDIAKQARRENFHGAYTENGKQYLSDGSFVAEFNTVDESLEQRADFPGKIATQEIAEAFERPAQGNFDIHETEDGYVKVGNSVFDSKYVNAMVRAFDNPKFSIAKHRGGHEVLLVTGDNGRAVLMPVEAGENVNVAYEAQELAPTAENTYPEDFAPITEDEANALSEENLASLTDEDAPDEAPAPYYESENIDPFEDREMKEVSKDRKVNAYQYDNPEVKPFFQEEANILLGELQRTQKPETIYNGDLKYGMTYEAAQDIPDIYRTPRMTTESIEYLRDTVGMSYADIEKGLKAIIEDKGAENIAAAKKIEFHINDRLIHGYNADGVQIPPNQNYVNLLEAKHNEEKGAQITAQGEEAFEHLMDDLAPAKKTPDLFETSGSGQISMFSQPKIEKPLKEKAYETIRPPKQSAEPTPEPRMKRVDSEDIPTYEKTERGQSQRTMFSEDKIAEILTEETAVDKNKRGAWSMFKNNVLDKGMVFEDLSLETGNRELQARWNSIRYAENKAQRFMEKGGANTSSLKSIRETVEKSGKTKQFYEYLYHLHNVDRMSLEDKAAIKAGELRQPFANLKIEQVKAIAAKKITEDTTEKTANTIRLAREYLDAVETKNKPVFGDSVTAEVSQEKAAKLEKANPEFKTYAKEVYDYMNSLREALVDGGVISSDTAKLWAEMYPHYVPIRRDGKDGAAINVPLDTNRTGVNAPIKRATGGNSDILPLFDTMALRTEQTFKAIAKNRFGVELKNTLGTTIYDEAANVDEAIDSIETQDELLQEGKNGASPTFTVFEDGKKVTFEITEEMYDAMKPASKGLSYTNKVANTVGNVFRGLLTEYNPVFLATNAVKDVQDVLINSQHATKTYAAIPKAITQMATKGHYYQEYLDNGGERNSYFDSDSKTFKAEDKGVKKLLGIPLKTISSLNNTIERVPRLAEYIASREAGASVDVAMLDAARVTTNFAAGGDLTKMLNRNGFNFLNASTQGAVQQVRNIREAKANGLKGWVQLAAKVSLAGLPAILLNNLLWDDDEEYEELSDYVKDNYYVVAKYGDGQFVRIPKGRALAVIQDAFEQVGNMLTGDDEVDLRNFLELAITNLAPNNPLENNILAPLVQAHTNKAWYGDDIVPTRLQDLPAAEQFDESTDALSKWLGEKTNLSPYRLNYLLNQYSGGIGDVFLPMLTPETDGGGALAPWKDKFTTDSVMKNQNVTDFYDTMDKLTANAKSSKATDEDVLKYKYFNVINSELSELYQQKREIQNGDLPDDEKSSAARELQEQIVSLTRDSLNTYKNVNIEDGYASIGDVHFRQNDEGEWQKISDEQLEKQEEVTSGLGISAEEYWGNKEEYDYAYKNPEKYKVAKAVGGYSAYKTYQSELYDINADKDENGKSINGSRKEKVIDYVNNLDADYGTKIILFKSEYKSDDSYNYDIIDYLDNREDISYEEMVTILKELDFTVHSDGRVTWD